jgi:hypothetical protein
MFPAGWRPVIYIFICGDNYTLVMHSAPNENEETLLQRNLMPAKQFLSAPGLLQVCDSP